MDIIPIKRKTKNNDKIPYPLLQPSFLMIIHAPPKSGKTNLCINLLSDKRFGYIKTFENIIYISPTIEQSEDEVKVLHKNGVSIITEELDNLNEILEGIIEIQQKDNEPTLIVLDDMVGYFTQSLGFLCSRYRHYNLSIIICTQNFRSVPIICRNSADAFLLFKSHNELEMKKIDEELGGFFPNFMQYYHHVTDQKYHLSLIHI